MNFPDSFLEELSARNDIAEVVSGYVQLTKKTGANLFGLCPFHSEKTPSFSVNTEKQIYHCFGCGKGGTVIRFIMDVENLSFPDAVQFLARRAGMEVPGEARDETYSRRSRMLELNKAAARYFYEQLHAPGGEPARAYVRQRQISGSTVVNFGLGYAPDSWSSLCDAMQRMGYTKPELIDAGLARAGKNGGIYDYYRNRLMFPVIDVRGSVLGFSGRILGDEKPKYLNSPNTLVFSKERNLFGLNLAKKTKGDYLLLVEGNVDVVSLHQAGFDGAVASLGTAFTPDQARLMARYTNQVVLAYDADAAGQKATQKAISLLAPLDIKVRVLRIPGAKDPDEYIKANGADAFRRLLEQSGNDIEYRLARVEEEWNPSTDDGRVRYSREAARLIASLPNEIEREVYGMRAAERAGVSAAAFMAEVKKLRKQLTEKAHRQTDSRASAPLRSAQPAARSLHFSNVRSAKAEQGLLGLLYRSPELFGGDELTPGDFTSEALGHIYTELRAAAAEGRGVSAPSLEGRLSADELSLLIDIMQSAPTLTEAQAKAARDDYIKIIKEEQYMAADAENLTDFANRLKKTKGYSANDGQKNGR